MDNASFWMWSLKLYRTSTLEVRASWTLGVWMLFDAIRFAQAGHWAVFPFAFVVPLVSMYLHAMAHVGMARLVGGSADRTVLAILNDQSSLQVPLTWPKQFMVGAAGPVVSLVIWLASELGARLLPPGFTGDLLAYVAICNFWITVLNLLACAMFDGARMWRAVLWPLVGLGRAVRWTVFLSFACCIGLIALSFWWQNWMLLICSLGALYITIQEHRSVRLGFDPIFQIEFDAIEGRRSQSWFGRWQQRRRIRALERQEREESDEQDLLDRLLVKVSEHGLPALSEAERGTLQRISRKQKARQETGIF